MAIFFPLQGFFNFLVYCRPRYLRCKSRNPNLTTRKLLWLTLHPEEHTKSRGQAATQERQAPHVVREDYNQRGRGNRRSVTASYYSVGNSIGRYQDTDDDYTAINTVKAVADENDYRLPDRDGTNDNAGDTSDVQEETRSNSITEGSKVEPDRNSEVPVPDEEDQRLSAEKVKKEGDEQA